MMAATLLAACAGHDVRSPQAGVGAVDAELDAAAEAYEAALAQHREGGAAAAEAARMQALDRLGQAASRCGETPDCDPHRVFQTFDRLLRLDAERAPEAGIEAAITPSPAALAAAGQGAEAALPELVRSVRLLRGQPLPRVIASEGPVKAQLEMWLTQWRPQLQTAWVNYQYLRSEMWPAYEQAGLPEALLFGILAKESGGKVHAVSRSGASGPLQFMYATGLRFGLAADSSFDLRFDPAASARANAEYVSEQLKIFNDNLELVLAAYNGGEGRMRRVVGDDTALSLADPRIWNQLSAETRDYVPGVLAAAWLFQHPDSYNLRFPKLDAAPGRVTLARPASLAELTVCLGSAGGMRDGWFRTLRNMNPRLDPAQALPAGTLLRLPKTLEKPYANRCVDGPWPILAADLHRAALRESITPPPATAGKAAPATGRTRSYKVRRGDTLTSIAKGVRCAGVRDIAELNGLRHHHLSIGQMLRLPVCR